MPELPEIEHLKRTLEPRLLGVAVTSVRLRRRDIVRNVNAGAQPPALLRGETVVELRRHGKHLAIIGSGGGALCVHLGMSGQLRHVPPGRRIENTTHVHCEWTLRNGAAAGRLIFRDPRRFGGLWDYDSIEALEAERFADLGPDALVITAEQLHERLRQAKRPIKAALLDQSVVAGIGNIYADESLHLARIHPLREASRLRRDAVARLLDAAKQVLRDSIDAGGSTLRDYVDAAGTAGGFSGRHLVYGRGGEGCVHCGSKLRAIRVAQRSTIFCPRCQRCR